MEALSFKLEVFEGPLELLLHLIQKNKVSIYDIPVSIITQQYMEYLEQMEAMDLEVSSAFLVMAAKLLYIKSKLLLPKHEEAEEEAEEDPRQELILSLAEYKRYKEVSRFFADRKGICDYLYFKEPEKLDEYKRIEMDNIPIDKLTDAFERVMTRLEKRLPPSKMLFSGIVGREPVSVKSKVSAIRRKFVDHRQLTFDGLFVDVTSRSEIVAVFLAVLEMIRNCDLAVSYENQNVILTSVENGDVVG